MPSVTPALQSGNPLAELNAADQWRQALRGQFGGLPHGVPQDPRGPLGQLPVPSAQLPVPSGQLPVPSGQLPVPPGQLPVPSGQLLQGPGLGPTTPWPWATTSASGQGWRGEFSDPPSWPGWQYRRQWVAAVRRWNKLSDIPMSRRAEKVLRTLGWELQVEFEHLQEDVLISDRYLEAIISVIELKAGVREDDEKRAAFKRIMVDNVRKREESLSQYVTRRMRDFTKAMMFGISIPEEFRATMLKEGAGLNDQGLQNLTALLQGQDHSVDRVAAVLARMDARTDRITGFVEVPEEREPSGIYLSQGHPVDSEDEDSEGAPEEIAEDEMILAELTDMDFSESQAALVFAIMENRIPRTKRTWRENKKYKADLRKDRASFTKGPSAEHRGGGFRSSNNRDEKHRGRMSKDQLKKISKCNTCGRRGHWSEDCPSNRPGGNGDAAAKVQGFCYLGGPLHGAATGYLSETKTSPGYFSVPTTAYVTFQKKEQCMSGTEETWAFLTIPSGMAILDIGATQDIIGLAALKNLEQELARCNLQPVVVPTTTTPPTGIGGPAKISKTVLVPMSPGGVPGVVQFVAIEDNVPPLLSVGLLEHLGATFDLTTNRVNFKSIGVDMIMTNLPTGHRAISLVQWKGGHFPVPPAAKEQFGLEDDAFMKKDPALSAYTKRVRISQSCDASLSSVSSVSFNTPEPIDTTAHDYMSRFEAHEHDRDCSTSVPHPGECFHNSCSSTYPCDCSGSVALMGNIVANCQSQFDSSAYRLDHGTPSRNGGGGGADQWPDTSLAPAGHQDVLSLRDPQSQVPQAGRGGDSREERVLREEEVPHGRCPGPGHVSASTSTSKKSKSARFVDRVLQVRGEADLHLQESGRQGEVSSQELSLHASGASNVRAPDGRCYAPAKCRPLEPRGPERADPPRAERDSTGNGGELSERGRDAARVGSRPKPNDSDDAAEHAGGSGQPVNGRGSAPSSRGRRGDASRSPGDGGRGLVANIREPECYRPAMRYWPRWMTIPMISLSSSLLSWGQMTRSLRQLVIQAGGDDECWVLHHAPPPGEAVPRLPHGAPFGTTSPPWITSTTSTTTREEVVLWHEVRDERGKLLGRGLGEPSRLQDAEGGETIRWSCPRALQIVHESRDDLFQVKGNTEDGKISEQGPFWMIRAPRLQRQMYPTQESEATFGEEQDKAEKGLIRLAQQQRRDLTGAQVDVVEVFGGTLVTSQARERGLRVPPSHEDFTYRAGWNATDKNHRRKLRKFLDSRNPTTVVMHLHGGEGVEGFNIAEKFERLLALQIARHQHDQGRFFYLEDSLESALWSTEEWRKLEQSADVQFFQAKETKRAVATNLVWEMGTTTTASSTSTVPTTTTTTSLLSSSSGREDTSETERLAQRLHCQADFSHAACLRLLNQTQWPRQRTGRQAMQGSEVCQVLGQYSYGKFSGTTLATFRLPHTLRYLNEYMTMHGATGPRSTLAITRNARVQPHRDLNNVGHNCTIAIGSFKGGDLWTENDEGSVCREAGGRQRRGVLRKHRNKMMTFDARKWHSVEPWQGERWSITAYQTRSAMKLEPEQRELLESFGFSPSEDGARATSGFQHSEDLVNALICQSCGEGLRSSFPTTSTPEEIEELSDLEEEQGRVDHTVEGVRSEPTVSQHQKDLVRKLHVNTGHPPLERFLRTLRAAGTLPHVLKYVRDEFKCEACAIKKGPDPRRKATCPRVFSFNKVLSMDVFFIQYKDAMEPILNVVCHGTNYQMAHRITSNTGAPTAHATWKALLTTWVRHLGAPNMVITDGGKEFQGRYERGLEQLGVLHHVTAPESPWQNSRAERHGGWLKQRLSQELDSGQGVVTCHDDLDELLASLVSAKNRWFNNGGFTPAQMVFGELPRVPGELLSSDEVGMQTVHDALHDPAGQDEMASEFKKRIKIRERAQQLAMSAMSKETVKRALRTSMHPTRAWRPGQWVYCFRKGKPGDVLHPVSRWVGPGVVVLNTSSVVWVAMRTRLWRCTPEQLRPVFPSEVLGRQLASDPQLGELLRKVVSGSHAGAVDVTKEAPPAPEDDLAPVDRGPEGEHLPPLQGQGTSSPTTEPPALEPPQAPQRIDPIPPGFLPTPEPPLPPPGIPPPAAATSTSRDTSRRSSVQEPAQEPEVAEPIESRQERLPAIHEDGHTGSSETEERPPKFLRTQPEKESGGASGSTDALDGPTRAPGTPLRGLLQAVHRGRESDRALQEGASALSPRSRSRTPDREGPEATAADEDLSLFSYQEGKWNLVATRSDEVDLKQLSEEERIQFDASDKVEWEAILKTKAVRVVYGKEADKIRQMYPERVLNSRMVRRKKPLPGINNWKPKSRWCIAGHSDPDTASLRTFAPTPSTEGMLAFLHTGICMGFKHSCDVKNAFCQSEPLRREAGPLFAEPTEGLHLPAGALIVIEVPVYGLDDAPASWRMTVVNFLSSQGYVRNLVEPCWWSRFDSEGRSESQVLIEVDDFIIGARPEIRNEIKKIFQERFDFGKWEEDCADYAGRRVQCLEDRVLLDQEKYITEQVTPIPLPKHRRAMKDAELTEEEFQAMRSAVYKINWIAKETRPEMSGLASIMASKLKKAVIDDILVINKSINFLRATASRPLILWKMGLEDLAYVAISDAGGVGMKHTSEDDEGLPTDHTQGAWIIMATETLPIGKQKVRASPMSWRSSKLKRKVYSTFGGETQAMLQAISEVDWIQVMVRDATRHDVELRSWRNSLSPHMLVMKKDVAMDRQPQCTVTDAKSLYDCLLKEHPQGKQDRRSALELAIIVKDLQETRSTVRWVPHQKMIADSMTKPDPLKANGALEQTLKTGILSLVDVGEELAYRAADTRHKARSHSASTARLLREYEENGLTFWSTLIGGSCEDYPVGVVKHF